MSSTPTNEWQTYWCHECDLSIHLLTTTTPLCPHCHHDFLELMDPIPTSTTADTATFLLDSPSFLNFLQHLNTNSHCDCEDDNTNATIDSIIPTIKITSCMLEMDPMLVCAVCKDQFLIDVEAKQLPCSHLYHPGCILPWLSNHNSCPLCRFQLQTPVVREENLETWSPDHPHHDANHDHVGVLSTSLPPHFWA
ncbi:hypothetical protein Peur_002188 [Populus x canadensis]